MHAWNLLPWRERKERQYIWVSRVVGVFLAATALGIWQWQWDWERKTSAVIDQVAMKREAIVHLQQEKKTLSQQVNTSNFVCLELMVAALPEGMIWHALVVAPGAWSLEGQAKDRQGFYQMLSQLESTPCFGNITIESLHQQSHSHWYFQVALARRDHAR